MFARNSNAVQVTVELVHERYVLKNKIPLLRKRGHLLTVKRAKYPGLANGRPAYHDAISTAERERTLCILSGMDITIDQNWNANNLFKLPHRFIVDGTHKSTSPTARVHNDHLCARLLGNTRGINTIAIIQSQAIAGFNGHRDGYCLGDRLYQTANVTGIREQR